MMDVMRTVLFLALLIPLCAFASPIVDIENEHSLKSIEKPHISQEFFGRLDDYPHTFTFDVEEPLVFRAAIAIHDAADQKNDASIILVKKERRGVSEVGRTHSKESEWNEAYEPLWAETFRSGGSIESSLEPGTYILEVSAPNNDAAYQLSIGDTTSKRSYFHDLSTLFGMKSLYGTPFYSVLFSPLIYWPVLIFILVLIIVSNLWLYRKHRLKA
jgi:hypothetical protein